jgi:uncharacterized cupin superfamily protein
LPQRPPFVHTKSPVDFQPAPINPAWIKEGAPIARAARLSQSLDGFASTFMWDCSPGKFEWFYPADETLHILGGEAVLDEGLPTERRISAGDVVYFPAGSHATWHVIDHILKVAFLRRPLPGPIIIIANFLREIKHRRRRPMFAVQSEPASASLSL